VSVPDTLFGDMHAALFDQFAVAATVQRGAGAATPIRVVVQDGVAQLGQHGTVIGRVTKISFIRSEYLPARGDLLTIDGNTRKVEAIDTDDGMIVEAVLHG
jgi:hypothetical protein